MNDLIIEGTEETPEINFSAKTGEIKITGRSYASDITAFYKKLDAWLDEYLLHPNDTTTLMLQIDYNNSVSSRLIFDLILKCKSLADKGKDFKIKWYHHEGDDDSIDNANLVSKVINYPIENIETD